MASLCRRARVVLVRHSGDLIVGEDGQTCTDAGA